MPTPLQYGVLKIAGTDNAQPAANSANLKQLKILKGIEVL